MRIDTGDGRRCCRSPFLLNRSNCVELNELQQTRLHKLERLREQGLDPFPPRVEREYTSQQVLDDFDAFEQSGAQLTLAGRIMLRRVMGGSSFAHIADESGRIQIFLSKKDLDPETYRR